MWSTRYEIDGCTYHVLWTMRQVPSTRSIERSSLYHSPLVQFAESDKGSVTLYRETYDPPLGGRGFVLLISALGDVLLERQPLQLTGVVADDAGSRMKRIPEQLLVSGDRPVVVRARTVGHRSDLRLIGPLTHCSILPLPEICIQALEHRRRTERRLRMAAGEAWAGTGLVLTTRLGDPIDPRSFQRAFRSSVRRAGVPVISVHSTGAPARACSWPSTSTRGWRWPFFGTARSR